MCDWLVIFGTLVCDWLVPTRVVTSVVEYDELGTADVERAQVDASSPV